MSTTTSPAQHPDYELIDSGNGHKLERYGDYLLMRPDPQALWKPMLSKKEWDAADATFVREGKKASWKTKKHLPETWNINISGMRMEIAPTIFKHTGIFPEHAPSWKWMQNKISDSLNRNPDQSIKVLNLFGYTGAASIACAQAGAEVTHVDGSKISVAWAKRNQHLSELGADSIRWIVDDVITFIKREIKRGKTYDAIIMDPPSHGRGPTGEVWQIEKDLPILIELCQKLLSVKPLFVILNGYASGFSSLAYYNNLLSLVSEHQGKLEHGELTLTESHGKRKLPCGIYARWCND